MQMSVVQENNAVFCIRWKRWQTLSLKLKAFLSSIQLESRWRIGSGQWHRQKKRGQNICSCIFFKHCPFNYIFRHGRFKRSNSVTTAVQADMELEGFPSMEDKGLQFGGAFGRHSEPSTPTQYGAIRTVRTQGLFSYREDYRPSSGPPSPQPEPWLVEPSLESTDTGRVSPIRRDGNWFMQLLHNETKRLEGWCKEMEREAEENDLSEDSECPEGSFCYLSSVLSWYALCDNLHV